MVLCTDKMWGTYSDVGTLASYIKAGSPVNDYDGLVMITSLHHTAQSELLLLQQHRSWLKNEPLRRMEIGIILTHAEFITNSLDPD